MLMEAYIVSEVPQSGGYEWYIYIPELFGLPQNAEEKLLFDQYDQQQNVKVEQKDVQNDLASIFLRSFKKVQQTSSITLTDEQKKFCVKARVVGIPNSKIQYFPGNVVVVGFQNNDMMKPFIVGQLLSVHSQLTAKMSIALDTLTVNEKAVFPITQTDYRVLDNTSLLGVSELASYTAADVGRVIQFLRQLDESGISVNTFVTLLTQFSALFNHVNKLFPLDDEGEHK